jgi:hypothetical protein
MDGGKLNLVATSRALQNKTSSIKVAAGYEVFAPLDQGASHLIAGDR